MSIETTSAISDREGICELLAAYTHRLDSRRFADVAALFTTNGEWRSNSGTATGRKEIEELLRGVTVRRDTGTGRQARRHFVANISITLQGNAAKVLSTFFTIQQTERGLVPNSMGIYNDTLIKEGTAWLFQLRDITREA